MRPSGAICEETAETEGKATATIQCIAASQEKATSEVSWSSGKRILAILG
jgi:hypothetical protein